MSFSHQIKDELISSAISRQSQRAMLYGMLMFSKSFSPSQIVFQTENKKIADCFSLLIEKSVKCQGALEIITTTKKKRSPLITLAVENESHRLAIFEFLGIDISQENAIDISLVGKKHVGSFVAGAFLACGSISDPLKEYHLEFVIPTMSLCNSLGEIFLDIGILAKQTERKNSYIVYLKESESIEDILTFMGAPMGSLEIMNVKILKNVRNKINRAVNCDSANIEKTIKASERQIEAIELIERSYGFDSLPDDLIEIAEFRRENPDWSLKELGGNLQSPISRSGANHRMNRIMKIADEIKTAKEKQ